MVRLSFQNLAQAFFRGMQLNLAFNGILLRKEAEQGKRGVENKVLHVKKSISQLILLLCYQQHNMQPCLSQTPTHGIRIIWRYDQNDECGGCAFPRRDKCFCQNGCVKRRRKKFLSPIVTLLKTSKSMGEIHLAHFYTTPVIRGIMFLCVAGKVGAMPFSHACIYSFNLCSY